MTHLYPWYEEDNDYNSFKRSERRKPMPKYKRVLRNLLYKCRKYGWKNIASEVLCGIASIICFYILLILPAIFY